LVVDLPGHGAGFIILDRNLDHERVLLGGENVRN
jgi:hypothetical protein